MKGAAVAFVMLLAGMSVSARDPSFPVPGSGIPNCILPIKTLLCTVDTHSGFVAGLQYGNKGGYTTNDYMPLRPPGLYGFSSVCSRGPQSQQNVLTMTRTVQQTVWDMTNTSDPSFPKEASGQPNLNYYYPLGGLITQMIVLEAQNPYGDSYGTVPAVIFRYLTNSTSGFAICGNARYANAYLNPLTSAPPPTQPTLQRQFVNPMSATNPQMYLSRFDGKCSTRGFGYMGGDPHTQSYYHVKYLYDACFAPLSNVTAFVPTPAPPRRPDITYNVTHTPCFWNKKTSKSSPSVSCALTGEVVATGKYGVILVNNNGQPMQAVPDSTGKLTAVQYQEELLDM